MKEKRNAYHIVRNIAEIPIKLFFRVKIYNKNNILNDGSLIIVSNHKSYIDPLSIAISTKRDIYFMAKKELHDGILGWFFKMINTIPVDRTKKDSSSVSSAVEALNNGKCIVIFPEATINKTKDLTIPFKFGAVSIADKTNSKILPCAVVKRFYFFVKRIYLLYGEAYNLESNDLEKENELLKNKIEHLIKELNNKIAENKKAI